MIPLAFLAGQMGWTVAEMGRQPWVIQDIMPTMVAVSRINAGAVKLTFVLFALIFTGLLIAEIGIMLKQIKLGPKEGGE
jgi:cytochrome d ubiquinol oxidase subunit I